MNLTRRTLRILTAAVLLFSIFTQPAAAASVTAAPMNLTVRIDGAEKRFEAYLIENSSYFRLRDIAYALSGTRKQFEVQYDAITGRTDLTTGAAYTPEGYEMVNTGLLKSATPSPVVFTAYLDGTKITMDSYLIGAYHYVKLRELAAAVDFGVTYVASSGSIAISTAEGYTPEETDASPMVSLDKLRVSMVGDSIGIGIESYLKKHLPLLENDSLTSRQFYRGKAIVKDMIRSGTLADTVIIELGANGTVKESDLRALIDLMGPDRKIVFVNVQVPRSWCEGNNKVFAKVIPDYANTIIADWYGASIGNSSYFAADQVHPSETGATALAQLIADALLEIL